MTRRDYQKVSPDARATEAIVGLGSSLTEPLLPGHWERWVELVASGEVEFPKDLRSAAAGRLGLEVRQRRRTRLIHYIARAIALDLWRAANS
jgi:hypothetical protein